LEKPRKSVKSPVHTMSHGDMGLSTAATPARARITNPAEMLITSSTARCFKTGV
jgi:hypothetical protein